MKLRNRKAKSDAALAILSAAITLAPGFTSAQTDNPIGLGHGGGFGSSGGGSGGGNAMSGGGGSGGFYKGGKGSVVSLALDPRVQAELELNDSQKSAITEAKGRLAVFENQMHGALQPKVAGAQNSAASFQAVRAAQQAHRLAVEKANQEYDRTEQRILGLLTPAQKKRVQEIRLQEIGASALFLPEIAQTLQLTREQQESLRRISLETGRARALAFEPPELARLRAEQMAARRTRSRIVTGTLPGGSYTASSSSGDGGGGGFRQLDPHEAAQLREKMDAITREADGRMLEEVLTSEQRTKLKQLQGREFKAPLP